MYYHWFVHLLCWFSGNAQGSAYFVFLRIRTPTGTVCGPSRPEACADSTRPGRVLQEKWNHFLMTWFITSDAFGLSIFCSTVYSSPIFKSLTSFWSGVLIVPHQRLNCLLCLSNAKWYAFQRFHCEENLVHCFPLHCPGAIVTHAVIVNLSIIMCICMLDTVVYSESFWLYN